jgi:FkbH-like protein
VIDDHPHCVLKREHFVAHRVNWDDKERNIEAIVEELNIGMDAVVLVDDSAIECERVQSFLPDITVRTVPQHLYDLPLLFDREGLFDKLAVTDEDLKRTKLYQTEAKRRHAGTKFATVDEFLASLELKARIENAVEGRVQRVSQLTQKTNQFNLTTRRYSETDIARMINSSEHAVFTLTASDRFGDLGLTGVFIAQRLNNEEAIVDTLLMSCRVLGRKVEREFVARCIERLNEQWHPRRWNAEYIKTKKNEQVAHFWPTFGFAAEKNGGDGVRYGADPDELSLDHIPYINVEMS